MAQDEIKIGIDLSALDEFERRFNSIRDEAAHFGDSFTQVHTTIAKLAKSASGFGAMESSMMRLSKTTSAWGKDVSKSVSSLFSLGSLWKLGLGAAGFGAIGYGFDVLMKDASDRARKASGLGT